MFQFQYPDYLEEASLHNYSGSHDTQCEAKFFSEGRELTSSEVTDKCWQLGISIAFTKSESL